MNQVEWTPRATKQLRHLPDKTQNDIVDAVANLVGWPDVRNVKALQNRNDYRLRVGRYRVFFMVLPDGEITIIQITEVKKRDERTY